MSGRTILEARAVITAEDRTGAAFAAIEAKIAKLTKAASAVTKASATVSRSAASVASAHAAIQKSAIPGRMQRIAAGIGEAGVFAGGRLVGLGAPIAAGLTAHEIARTSAARIHERIRMQGSGMTANEVARAEQDAAAIAAKFPSIGQTEVMHMLRNARSVVGTYQEAAEIIEPLAKLRVVAQAARPGQDISEDFDHLVRAAELSGVTQDHGRFRQYIDGIARAIGVFGDTIKPYQFFEAAQYGRAATMGLSKEFVAGVLPTLIQHHGGSQAGTALASAYQAIVGGKMSNQAVQQLYKLGLLDESKIVKTKTGNVKGVQPGGIKGSDLFRTDPDKWFRDYYARALETHGITDAARVAEITARVFSNRIAAALATEMIQQQGIFDKDRALVQRAPGVDEASRLYSSRDPHIAFQGLKHSIDSLVGTIGSNLGEGVAPAMNAAAKAIGGYTAELQHMRNERKRDEQRGDHSGLTSRQKYDNSVVDSINRGDYSHPHLLRQADRMFAQQVEQMNATGGVEGKRKELAEIQKKLDRARSGWLFGGQDTMGLPQRRDQLKREIGAYDQAVAAHAARVAAQAALNVNRETRKSLEAFPMAGPTRNPGRLEGQMPNRLQPFRGDVSPTIGGSGMFPMSLGYGSNDPSTGVPRTHEIPHDAAQPAKTAPDLAAMLSGRIEANVTGKVAVEGQAQVNVNVNVNATSELISAAATAKSAAMQLHAGGGGGGSDKGTSMPEASPGGKMGHSE